MTGTWSPADVLGPDLARDDQARTWRARAREFARDVVQPIGEALDAMEPARGAPRSARPVYDLLAQAQREGFTRLGAPRRLGGVPVSRGRRAPRARGARHGRRGARRADRRRARAVPVGGGLGRAVARRPASRCHTSRPRGRTGSAAARSTGPMAAVRATPGAAAAGCCPAKPPPVPGAAVATHALLSPVVVDGRAAGGARGRAARPPPASGACRPGTRWAACVVPRADRARRRPRARTTTSSGAGAARGVASRTRRPRAPCWRSASAAPPTRERLRWAREAVWAGRRRPAAERCCRSCTGCTRLLDGDPRARARDLPAGRRPLRRPTRTSAPVMPVPPRRFAADAAFEVARAAVRLCGPDSTPARRGVPRRLGLRSRQVAARRASGTPRPEGEAPWASSRRLRRSPASST